MQKYIGLFVMFVMMSASVAGSKNSQNFKNPCIPAVFVKNATDSKAAQKLPAVKIHTNMVREYKDSYKTSFKISADRENLFLTVNCDELPVWVSPLAGHDRQYWDEDSIEFFIAANKPEKYYHYIVSSKGFIYDEKGADPAWNGTAKASVVKNKNSWQLKLVVKAKDLGINEFSEGMTLYGNVIRNIGCNQEKRVWSNLGNTFHQPARFGKIRLCRPSKMTYGDLVPRISKELSEKKGSGENIFAVKGKLYGPESSPVMKVVVKNGKEFTSNSEPFDVDSKGVEIDQIISHKSPTSFQISLKGDDNKILWRQQAIRLSLESPLQVMPVSWKVFPGLNAALRITLISPKMNEKVIVTVSSKDNKKMFHREYSVLAKDKYTFFAKVPMKKWKTGKYSFCIKLKNNTSVKPEYLQIEKHDSKVLFSKYKWPVLKGKEFFPLGMMMPWPNLRNGKVIYENSAKLVLQDLDKVKNSGFNSVILAAPQWYMKEAVKTLDKAQKLGLNLVWSGASMKLKKEYCDRYSNLFAWYGMDEPEGHSILPADARRYYMKTRSLSAQKYPLLATHMWTSALPEYLGSRDIVVTDPYMVGEGRFLGQVVEYVRAMKASCGDVLPCWTILQFHKLGKQLKVPTPKQMRCQTFLALIAGIDGIFYYSTATPEEKGWRLFNDPVGSKTWKSMKKLNSDVMKYSKIYRNAPLKASKTKDSCEKTGVYWRLDLVGGKKILTVINSNEKSIKCKLPLRGINKSLSLAPYEVKIVNHLKDK